MATDWRKRARAIPIPVRRILQDTYTDHGCVIWWENPNRQLGGSTPAETWPLHPESVIVVAERIEGCSL